MAWFPLRLSRYRVAAFIFAMYAANNCNCVCLSSVAHTLQVMRLTSLSVCRFPVPVIILYTFRYTLSIRVVHKYVHSELYIFVYNNAGEVIMMPMSYAKLFQLMESKGLKKFDLRKAGISPTIVDRLIKGHDVNTSTITRLCRLLGCQPGDIMEYIDESEAAE